MDSSADKLSTTFLIIDLRIETLFLKNQVKIDLICEQFHCFGIILWTINQPIVKVMNRLISYKNKCCSSRPIVQIG